MKMGIYRKVCYFVEDGFVKLLGKNQDPQLIKAKVTSYRNKVEFEISKKKEEATARLAEQKRIQDARIAEQRRIQEEKRKREEEAVLTVLSNVVDIKGMSYTQYEFNEVKRNKYFFESLLERVFDDGERGLTFLHCEFDKTKKKEIRGYLVVTNKRVLFLTKDLNFMDKFRYQTIINVSWFKDGFIERGLYIQYGKRKLEFDEIYDAEQMKRVGNLILNLSATRRIG
jgi:hypothetical protein